MIPVSWIAAGAGLLTLVTVIGVQSMRIAELKDELQTEREALQTALEGRRIAIVEARNNEERYNECVSINRENARRSDEIVSRAIEEARTLAEDKAELERRIASLPAAVESAASGSACANAVIDDAFIRLLPDSARPGSGAFGNEAASSIPGPIHPNAVLVLDRGAIAPDDG